MKKVIINADDFGYSSSCNRAILQAFKMGLITDTSIMANGKGIDEAIKTIEDNDYLANKVGVHFVLSEGVPLTSEYDNKVRFILDGTYSRFLVNMKRYILPLNNSERRFIYNELSEQLRKLERRGIYLTHADSHQHVHYNFAVLKIVIKVCKEHKINKIRMFKNVQNQRLIVRLYGAFINWYIKSKGFKTVDYFGNVCEYKKIREGVSELMVHPDFDENGVLIDRKKRVNNEQTIAVGKRLEESINRVVDKTCKSVDYISL